MKKLLIWLLLLVIVVSCNNSRNADTNQEQLKTLHWNNQYAAFDEPGGKAVSKMEFYLLAVHNGLMDSLTILSIRQDSNELRGFYKKVRHDEGPTFYLSIMDTNRFRYSTVSFVPNIGLIDSIRGILGRNAFCSLKDTIQTNATDGTFKELILYDGQKFCHLFRGYGVERELEPRFINAFREIMNYVPPDPIPRYKR